MTKRCLKCDYVRKDTDTESEDICPNCSAVYAKVDAAIKSGREFNKAAPTTTKTATNKKNCPYCGEEILAIAKKCKHCKSDLPVIKRAKVEPPYDGPAIRPSIAILGIIFLVLPVLALLVKCSTTSTDAPSRPLSAYKKPASSSGGYMHCTGNNKSHCDTFAMFLNIKGKGCYKMDKIKPLGNDTYRLYCELASYDRSPITYTFKFINNKQDYIIY